MENLLSKINVFMNSFLNMYDLYGGQESKMIEKILKKNDKDAIRDDWYGVGLYIKNAIRDIDNER